MPRLISETSEVRFYQRWGQTWDWIIYWPSAPDDPIATGRSKGKKAVAEAEAQFERARHPMTRRVQKAESDD